MAPSHCATFFAATPPTLLNEPPKNTLPLPSAARDVSEAKAFSCASVSCQVVPSHLATREASVPPAAVKLPAATMSPLERGARASISVPDEVGSSTSKTPEPPSGRPVHAVEFHLATWLAADESATVKGPAASRAPPLSKASADIESFMPSPRADQAVPSHLATDLLVDQPMLKLPATYRFEAESTASARTTDRMPLLAVLTAPQEDPLHFAT